MEGEETRTRYQLDLNWYEESGKSFAVMSESRMCTDSRSKLGTEVEERVPTVDSKTGKVVFELKKAPFAHNPLAHIRDCCSKKKGFIISSLPVMEAIFRLYLMNANQPLDAEEIKQQLEWTDYTERIRYISIETLERLLKNDVYYGFRPSEQPVLASEG